MKIQEVEIRTGLDRSTIRFYEKEGLLLPVRKENGYRDYSVNDVEILLKIKLLRQLSVSMDSIADLQKGNISFSCLLHNQMEYLSKQIHSTKNARSVCELIHREQTSFSDLNAGYYLQILEDLQTNHTLGLNHDSPKHSFKEDLPGEFYPYRRFCARFLDHYITSAILTFLLLVVLRIRGMSNYSLLISVISYLCGWIMIPLTSAQLHLFGTTLGKWILGIKLEQIEGRKLSFEEAWDREWSVFQKGFGYQIPIFCYYRLYRSFKQYKKYGKPDWDEDTEITYTDRKITGKVIYTAVVVLGCFLNIWSINDTNLPIHRSGSLTVAQFSQNVRNYQALFQTADSGVLLSDGTWSEELYYNDFGVQIQRPAYYFELSNECIETVKYEIYWQYYDKDTWPIRTNFPDDGLCAVFAVAGAQKGIGAKDLVGYAEALNAAWIDEPGEYQILLGDVRVSWVLTVEPYIPESNMQIEINGEQITDFYRMCMVLIIKP